jgi:hypothetical protein
MMEEVHWRDARKNDYRPYIHHQVEMIMGYLDTYESEISYEDILVFALHDALEDHPESWRDILDVFWLEIFRDVLVLSTGWISFPYRKEIILYFLKKYNFILFPDPSIEWQEDILYLQKWVGEILRILSPVDPLFKHKNESQYKEDSPEFQKIANAITFYKQEILIKKDTLTPDEVRTSQEYLWLGNYLYFTPTDARRKLQDMLHNMRDMEIMEKRKPGYIASRRIKSYILSVILRNYGMFDELALLQGKFHDIHMQIPLDGEVYEAIK